MAAALLVALGLIAFGLMGCAGMGIPGSQTVTPTKAFNEASQAFENAWESYHTVWLALPKEDPRKAKWLKDYHPKFRKAGAFLELWGKNYADPTKPIDWDAIEQELTAILIQLAIKRQ
jgi:hypothetical protein